MKKYFLVAFCALLLFVATGCGKKQLKCSGSFNEAGMSMDAEMIADLDDNDNVLDVTAVMDLKDSKTADQFCAFYKLAEDADKGISIKCSGSKITITGFSKLEAEDEDEEDKIVGKPKDAFIKAMEEEGFTCK